jgi:hypothetical protein
MSEGDETSKAYNEGRYGSPWTITSYRGKAGDAYREGQYHANMIGNISSSETLGSGVVLVLVLIGGIGLLTSKPFLEFLANAPGLAGHNTSQILGAVYKVA